MLFGLSFHGVLKQGPTSKSKNNKGMIHVCNWRILFSLTWHWSIPTVKRPITRSILVSWQSLKRRRIMRKLTGGVLKGHKGNTIFQLHVYVIVKFLCFSGRKLSLFQATFSTDCEKQSIPYICFCFSIKWIEL